MLAGRVSLGVGADMLDPSPSWTVLDTLRDNFVAKIEIHDGRQTEQDITETGTATVYLNDRDGYFDPANTGSPFYGNMTGTQIALAVWNPLDLEWVPQWRGFIDNVASDLNPATKDGVSIQSNVQLECVDIFDYLGNAHFRIGYSGDAVPPGAQGSIFYENGDVHTRVVQVLSDAGIDSTMWVAFDGNVDVSESQYDVNESFLIGLRDAADAEFPGLANVYVDKLGRVVFHGRYARLEPDAVFAGAAPGAWDFNRWKAGDGAAILSDPDNAQIRELSWARSRSRIINSAIAYPAGTDDTHIAARLKEAAGSIARFGIHSRSDIDLQLERHHVDGSSESGEKGILQADRYSLFWITYYADPLTRIERITVKSVRPTDERAAATWAFLTGVSISDIVNVTIGTAGGVGIQSVDYYVEGRDMTITPLQPGFDMIELSLNISPSITDTEGIFAPFS